MQKICLVIPCYNEALRFRAEELIAHLGNQDRFSVCLVDDGSTDSTRDLLETVRQAHPARVSVLPLAENSGKAEAVRQGILHVSGGGNGDLVGYFDADFATPLGEIGAMVKLFEERESLQFVFGSRVKLVGRDIRRNEIRHYFGRVFSTLASVILGIPVYDTQCGAKVMRSDLAARLFAEPFRSRWLFDVELMQRLLRLLGRKRLSEFAYEHPLFFWKETGNSKITLRHLLGMPFELWAIWRSRK